MRNPFRNLHTRTLLIGTCKVLKNVTINPICTQDLIVYIQLSTVIAYQKPKQKKYFSMSRFFL